MVFRGLPTAGCDGCRKAKKRCGLELPACSRCAKRKEKCCGYRDTNQLIIRDQSEGVRRKVAKQQAKRAAAEKASLEASLTCIAVRRPWDCVDGPTNDTQTLTSTKGNSSGDTIIYEEVTEQENKPLGESSDLTPVELKSSSIPLSATIDSNPGDIATTYFFQRLTEDNYFLRALFQYAHMDPCLELAIRACGMAALTNVYYVNQGKHYARLTYGRALGLLNKAIQDPKKSKMDAVLITVSLLGSYENITYNRRQSVQSWSAHVNGATQLLKVRGTKQLSGILGRNLFREIRYQIISYSIWNDKDPPDFLKAYQAELTAQTAPEDSIVTDLWDSLAVLCLDFAKLRAQVNLHSMADVDAASQAFHLEQRLLLWSEEAMYAPGGFWCYDEIEVEDNEHVWDGKVFEYKGHPAPRIWNSWRCIRIMLSRMREMLCQRLHPDVRLVEELSCFRKTRRQMADDICATIPACLGQARPSITKPSVLVCGYGAVWALFFAGTCTLERVGQGTHSIFDDLPAAAVAPLVLYSAAYAQTKWILRRIEYLAYDLGLKWAECVASPLREEFELQERDLDERVYRTLCLENLG